MSNKFTYSTVVILIVCFLAVWNTLNKIEAGSNLSWIHFDRNMEARENYYNEYERLSDEVFYLDYSLSKEEMEIKHANANKKIEQLKQELEKELLLIDKEFINEMNNMNFISAYRLTRD